MFTFQSSWYKVTLELGIYGSNGSFEQEEQSQYLMAMSVGP
jgi:hypothetical protein